MPTSRYFASLRRRPGATWPIAALVLSLGPVAAAQSGGGGQVPAGMKVHRARAGTPDKGGWYEARSTEGHFRVSMPIPFNDATMRMKGEDGKDLVSYTIGSKSVEGVKFSTTEIPAIPGRKRPGPEAATKGLVRGFKDRPGLTVSRERYFRFEGHFAAEFRVAGGPMSAFTRMVALPDRAYLQVVEYPATAEEQVEPIIRTFLDSLKFQDPKPAEAKAKG